MTLLGSDTLAVERFIRTADGVEAVVSLPVPETTLTTYRLDLADDGTPRRYDAVTRRFGTEGALPLDPWKAVVAERHERTGAEAIATI